MFIFPFHENLRQLFTFSHLWVILWIKQFRGRTESCFVHIFTYMYASGYAAFDTCSAFGLTWVLEFVIQYMETNLAHRKKSFETLANPLWMVIIYNMIGQSWWLSHDLLVVMSLFAEWWSRFQLKLIYGCVVMGWSGHWMKPKAIHSLNVSLFCFLARNLPIQTTHLLHKAVPTGSVCPLCP